MEVFSDSRLVVGQVKGELKARDVKMQGYLSQVKHLQLDFEFFDMSYVSSSGNTHTDSLATLVTFSAQGLPRVILVEDLCKAEGVKKDMVQIHQVRVGPSWMDPIVSFLKDDTLLKLRKYKEKLIGSGCLRITSCTSAPILGRICYVYILKRQSYCSRSCMKGFVGVIQKEDLYLIELSPKDIGGWVCRRKPKSMSRSVINAKGLP